MSGRADAERGDPGPSTRRAAATGEPKRRKKKPKAGTAAAAVASDDPARRTSTPTRTRLAASNTITHTHTPTPTTARPRPSSRSTINPGTSGPASGPIPKPYLATAPAPVSALSRSALDEASLVAARLASGVSSRLVLPSSFLRSRSSPNLHDAARASAGGAGASAGTGAGMGTGTASAVGATEGNPVVGRMYAAGLAAPPLIVPAGSSAARAQALAQAAAGSSASALPSSGPGAGASRLRDPARRRRDGGGTSDLRMRQGNMSVASLGHLGSLGRIPEAEAEASGTGTGADSAPTATVDASSTPAPAPAPRRRRRRDEESRRRPTVTSREEGRALGLARGASMRRVNVWDEVSVRDEDGDGLGLEEGEMLPRVEDDPPPPFPFPVSTTRLPPSFAAVSGSPTGAGVGTGSGRSGSWPPRSPPPTFEQATGETEGGATPAAMASTTHAVGSSAQAGSLLTVEPPALGAGADLSRGPSARSARSARSRGGDDRERATSPAPTVYASAPSSPVLSASGGSDSSVSASASEAEQEEREDREAWERDERAGLGLEERVRREMERRAERAARLGGTQDALEAAGTGEVEDDERELECGDGNVSREGHGLATSASRAEGDMVGEDEAWTRLLERQDVPEPTTAPTPTRREQSDRDDAANSERDVPLSRHTSLDELSSPPEAEMTRPGAGVPAMVPSSNSVEEAESGEAHRITTSLRAEAVSSTNTSSGVEVAQTSASASIPASTHASGNIPTPGQAVPTLRSVSLVTNPPDSPVRTLSPSPVDSDARTLPRSTSTSTSASTSASASASALASMADPGTAFAPSSNVVDATSTSTFANAAAHGGAHADTTPRSRPRPLDDSSPAPGAPLGVSGPASDPDPASEHNSDVALSPTPVRKLTRGKAIRRSSSGLVLASASASAAGAVESLSTDAAAAGSGSGSGSVAARRRSVRAASPASPMLVRNPSADADAAAGAAEVEASASPRRSPRLPLFGDVRFDWRPAEMFAASGRDEAGTGTRGDMAHRASEPSVGTRAQRERERERTRASVDFDAMPRGSGRTLRDPSTAPPSAPPPASAPVDDADEEEQEQPSRSYLPPHREAALRRRQLLTELPTAPPLVSASAAVSAAEGTPSQREREGVRGDSEHLSRPAAAESTLSAVSAPSSSGPLVDLSDRPREAPGVRHRALAPLPPDLVQLFHEDVEDGDEAEEDGQDGVSMVAHEQVQGQYGPAAVVDLDRGGAVREIDDIAEEAAERAEEGSLLGLGSAVGARPGSHVSGKASPPRTPAPRSRSGTLIEHYDSAEPRGSFVTPSSTQVAQAEYATPAPASASATAAVPMVGGGYGKKRAPPPPPPALKRTLVSTTVGANLAPRRSIIRTADTPVTPRPLRQMSTGTGAGVAAGEAYHGGGYSRRPAPPVPVPQPMLESIRDDVGEGGGGSAGRIMMMDRGGHAIPPPLPPKPVVGELRADAAAQTNGNGSTSAQARESEAAALGVPTRPAPPPPMSTPGRTLGVANVVQEQVTARTGPPALPPRPGTIRRDSILSSTSGTSVVSAASDQPTTLSRIPPVPTYKPPPGPPPPHLRKMPSGFPLPLALGRPGGPRGPRPPPVPPRPWARVVMADVVLDRPATQPSRVQSTLQRPAGTRTHSAPSPSPTSDLVPRQGSGSGLGPTPVPGLMRRSPSERVLGSEATATATASGLSDAGTSRRGGAASGAEIEMEYTDLDVLISRLEGSGREYEGFTQISAFLGPGKSRAATPAALASLLPGLISVDSRRVTREGKVKLKLSLLGVRVAKCPVCLSQFKKDERGVILPECGHVAHEGCARGWFREDGRCFVCRIALRGEGEGEGMGNVREGGRAMEERMGEGVV